MIHRRTGDGREIGSLVRPAGQGDLPSVFAVSDLAAGIVGLLACDIGTDHDVAEELGLEVEQKYGLSRDGNDVDLGRSGIAAAFSVPRGATSTLPLNGGERHVVFTVTEVSQPLGAGPDAIDENTRARMAAGLSDDLLDQLVTRLQSVYTVSVNQGAIQQALSF